LHDADAGCFPHGSRIEHEMDGYINIAGSFNLGMEKFSAKEVKVNTSLAKREC
jgi:hypothetical protein